ncbi:hypothetical protein RND71_022372 [Anisodus tanguticus]|uniref:Uncharacterized protein n=1 Tax=Anisodus tanguticus TaxID=243964 RepID=A0AAE1RTK7_9SOLA|nr:hypothetical protein RND71_022372 [Anisodus tanguticus]
MDICISRLLIFMHDKMDRDHEQNSCTWTIEELCLVRVLENQHEPGSSVLHDIDTDFSSDNKIGSTDSSNCFSSPFNCSSSGSSPFGDPLTEFMEAVPSSENKTSLSIPELYLPGLVIHNLRRACIQNCFTTISQYKQSVYVSISTHTSMSSPHNSSLLLTTTVSPPTITVQPPSPISPDPSNHDYHQAPFYNYQR